MLQKIRALITLERLKIYNPMTISSHPLANKLIQQNLQNRPLTQEEIEERIKRSVQIEIKLINKNNTLAAADLTLLLNLTGPVCIKGFLIFRSSRENPVLKANINVAAPAKAIYGKYRPQVFFSNRQRWEFLQRLIYEKYLSVKGEQLKKELS